MDYGDEEPGPYSAEAIFLEALQSRARMGADLTQALQRQGPLYDLILHKRAIALSALDRLIDLDPNVSGGIAECQVTIRSFIEDCDWIRTRLEAASEADQQILELRGEPPHDDRDE